MRSSSRFRLVAWRDLERLALKLVLNPEDVEVISVPLLHSEGRFKCFTQAQTWSAKSVMSIPPAVQSLANATQMAQSETRPNVDLSQVLWQGTVVTDWIFVCWLSHWN